jgi:hypothetical protein
MRLLLVGLSLLLARAAEAGPCARPISIPVVRAAGGPLPEGGAVIVELGSTNDWHTYPKDIELESVKARLVRGPITVPLKLEVLAPGIARLVPDGKPGEGTWKLEGVPGPAVSFTKTSLPLPAPPVVKAVERGSGTSPPSPIGGGGGHWDTAGLAFGADVPAGVTGVIIYNEHGGALLFRPVTPGPTRGIMLYSTPGRCAPMQYGYPPNAGDKITARWLTSDGRLSDPSAVVQVRALTNVANPLDP